MSSYYILVCGLSLLLFLFHGFNFQQPVSAGIQAAVTIIAVSTTTIILSTTTAVPTTLAQPIQWQQFREPLSNSLVQYPVGWNAQSAGKGIVQIFSPDGFAIVFGLIGPGSHEYQSVYDPLNKIAQNAISRKILLT